MLNTLREPAAALGPQTGALPYDETALVLQGGGALGAYQAGEDVSSYWVAVPASDVDKAMSGVPPAWESYSIDSVERTARASTVEVTVVHEQGGQITYQFALVREGVGWKINGLTTAFNSMEGGI
jgi:hypothetical protein